mgnify:CR=1 FL=1
MTHRFLEWLLLGPGDKIVRVKSWRPTWVQGCLEWPCLLIDHHSRCRMTIWPVWNRYRIRGLFGR